MLIRLAARLAATSGLVFSYASSQAQVAWNDMCVGTPGDPAATWFASSYWSTNAVPTALQDVTFGGPCAVDVPTLVLTDGPNANGFPNAVMRSLIADSAQTPDPSISTLTVNMGGNIPMGGLPGTFTVGSGAFTLGSRFPSTVGISSDRWAITHTSTTTPTQIATDGARATLNITGQRLDVSHILRVGRGLDLPSVTSSDGELLITTATGPAGLTVDNQTQVGALGGVGRVTLDNGTVNTFGATTFVGTSFASTPSGLVAGSGTLDILDSFDTSGSSTTFANEILVGTLSGNGSASLFGDISVGTDAFGASFVVGRGVTYDAVQSTDLRGAGGLGIGGFEDAGFVASGNGFVAIDGGVGSIGCGFGGCTINGDLVIGDLGATTPNGYTPSEGSGGMGLNAFWTITGDVFVGNNGAIGQLVLDPSGDGGASFSANYVGVGSNGTGVFIVNGAVSATIDELALLPQTGPEDYRQGGRAELGTNPQNCNLSTRLMRASGNGDRFNWQSDRFELRAGRIFDWGDHSFVIPEPGFFDGAGRIETDTVNNGWLNVGYYLVFPPVYNDSLVIASNGTRPGNFTQSATGSLYLAGSYPTRLFDGNGEETVIIAGNANFNGTLVFDRDNSDYWLTDVQPGDTFNLFDVAGTITGQFVGIPANPSHLPPGLPELPFINPAYAGLTWDTTQLYTLGVIRVTGGNAVCDDIDFNNNGVFPEDQDVVDFFEVLAGGNPPTCDAVEGCNDIDFNNNGVFPEDQDVIDFFTVLAGGDCP